MKKTALLIAAALVVSAPLVAATSSLTYAASKAKSKAKAPAATKGAPSEEIDPAEANTAFLRALGALANSLSAQPAPEAPGKAKKKGKKG
jgi:hypothetical protein